MDVDGGTLGSFPHSLPPPRTQQHAHHTASTAAAGASVLSALLGDREFTISGGMNAPGPELASRSFQSFSASAKEVDLT